MKIFPTVSIALFLFVLTGTVRSNETDIVKISDDVYAFIAHGPGRDYVDGNSVLIITPQGAIVVDTRTDPKTAEEEIAEIKKLTDVPVKYIVNTHWHYDHILGNKSFRDAFPDLTIIAHSNCLKEMDQFVPNSLGREPGTSQEQIKTFRQELASGTDSEGKLLTEYEKTRRQRVISDIESFIAHPLPVYSPPDITFDSALTIYLGDLEVRIFNPPGGKAHTIGDAMVYIPARKLLVTGDVVVAPVPYALGIYVPGMIKTIEEIITMELDVIVPGHGSVLYDKKYLHNMVTLLGSAYSKVTDCRTKGLNVDECIEITNFEEYRSMFVGDDESNWSFTNYFSVPVIRSIYRKEP